MEETVAVGVKQESSTEKKDWNEKSTQQQTLFNRSICHARVKTLSQQHPQPPALPSGHTLSGTHTHTHTRARTQTHAHNRTNSYGCAHSLKLSHPQTRTPKPMQAHTQTLTHSRTHILTHTHTQTDVTHTHTQPHTHIYAHARMCGWQKNISGEGWQKCKCSCTCSPWVCPWDLKQPCAKFLLNPKLSFRDASLKFKMNQMLFIPRSSYSIKQQYLPVQVHRRECPPAVINQTP